MKTLKEKREAMAAELDKLKALRDLAEKENRDFTPEEDTQREEALNAIDKLKRDISLLEKEEEARKLAASAAGKPVETESKEEREASKRFDWAKAVAQSGDKRNLLDGVEKEMHQEAEREMRAIGKKAEDRAVLIPTRMMSTVHSRANITENTTTGIEKMSFIDHLYASTVLGGLATWNMGITDMRFPLLGEFTVEWEGEVDPAADGGNALSKVDLTPKRLASYAHISKQADIQHGGALASALMAAAAKSVGAYVELSVFTDKTSAGAPTDIKDAKTAITASNISVLAAKLIEEVATNNGLFGNLAYVWSANLLSELFTAAGVTGVQQLFYPNAAMVQGGSQGTVNGYRTFSSSQLEVVTANTPVVYFGDWAQLQIAQFGPLEVMMDPYTQAKSGMNVIHVNSYWDFAETKSVKLSIGEIAQTT